MKVVGLFSGIGGLELGFERAGYEIIGLCEINQFCRRVLAKHWPGVRLTSDIRDLSAFDYRPVNVIVGGFPCKGTSNAGRRTGFEHQETGLWSEYLRVITEAWPEWVVIENSSHGRKHWVPQVRQDLYRRGYETLPVEISAWDIGANHERRRCFVLANSRSGRCEMAEKALRTGRASSKFRSQWGREPGIPRVDDGLPDRLDRRRALGNAVVPQIAQAIGEAIMQVNMPAGHTKEKPNAN